MIQVGVEWVIPALAWAASWGGARASLNGTRKRVERMDAKLDTIVRDLGDTSQRVARLEGQLDVDGAD